MIEAERKQENRYTLAHPNLPENVQIVADNPDMRIARVDVHEKIQTTVILNNGAKIVILDESLSGEAKLIGGQIIGKVEIFRDGQLLVLLENINLSGLHQQTVSASGGSHVSNVSFS